MVDLNAVTVRRGGVPVLRNIDLVIDRGESIGVIGPNGAGKTTLLRLIATLIAPNAGEATILGVRVGTRAVDAIRPRIAMVGHLPALYPELTLEENLEHFCRLASVEPERARDSLERTGLAMVADRRASRCSNGMRRRADLARVMCTEPDLILLDEAHSGLDQEARAIVDHIVTTTCSSGGTAVLVSHEKEAVDVVTDWILPLSEGRLA